MATLHRPENWRLQEVAHALDVKLSVEAESGLCAWLDTLIDWNARLDLTAARTVNELVDLMVADAFVLSTRLAHGASFVDVGTGAGSPGLALAIVRPDLKATLVEPLTKRISFLRTVIGKVGRGPEVKLVRGRDSDVKERFDVAISRATLSPERWLTAGRSLASEVWVLLAKDEAPVNPAVEMVHDLSYQWPLTEAFRRMVAYRDVLKG